MGNKHRNTFVAIHEKPDRNDIEWSDFMLLVSYLGATGRQGSGSAHGIMLNGVYAVFHKPHPGHTIYPSDLKRILRFLKNAGIENAE
jgi:hypothetical protein